MRAFNMGLGNKAGPVLVVVIFALSLIGEHTTDAYASDQVVVTPVGFRMKSLEQDVRSQQIVVTLGISGGDHVVPILYMPTVNSDVRYLSAVNHPCSGAGRDSLCCLRDMKDAYDLDVSWAEKLELQEMQACNESVIPSSENVNVFSQDIFPLSLINSTVLQGGSVDAIPGVVYTYSFIDGEHVLELRMATTYIEDRAKITLVNAGTGTYKYEFFVGVLFATLRDRDPSIYTTVMQQNIEFTKSEFGFFAVGTEQDRSTIKQVETFIHQGKNPGIGELYQYIEVYADYNPNLGQDGKTVRIMTDTMRFVKAASAPLDRSDWTYPCTSTGFYGNTSSMWNALFATECLPYNPVFCTSTIENGRFYVPFDVSTATPAAGFISSLDKTKNLFFSFEIEFKDASRGTTFVETVYGTINLVNFPVLEHCTSGLLDYEDVTDTLEISVELGTDTPTTIGRNNNLQQTLPGNGAIVNQLTTVAPSYGAAVISIVVDGLDFAGEFSTKYQLDNLLIFNFLGASSEAYNDIMTQIKSGTGLLVDKAIGEDHFTITPNFNDTSCAEVSTDQRGAPNTVVNCLWRRAVVANVVQASARQSVYYKKDASPENETKAIDWVHDSFFPEDADDVSSIKFLREHCPKAYANSSQYRSLHDGAYGCIFVDPGYRWMSKAGRTDIKNPNMISDKTVVMGVLTILPMDYANSDANGNPVSAGSRRLFSMNGDGTGMRILPMPHYGVVGTNLRHTHKVSALATTDTMQDALKLQYANQLLSSPVVLTTAEMRTRLKKAFAHKLHHSTRSKLATIASHALSRKLLSDDDTMLEDLMEGSAQDIFAIANPFVVAPVNTAAVCGYEDSSWTTFSMPVPIPVEAPMPVIETTLSNYIRYGSKVMGGPTQEGMTTGFRFVPDAAPHTRRNLLQVTSYDGVSGVVNMEGILKTDATMGLLFNKMFYCIVQKATAAITAATAAGTTGVVAFTLDVQRMKQDVSACTVANGDTAEIEEVRAAMLVSCGKMDKLLPIESCNMLYKAMVLAVPTIAFDWYSLQTTAPKLFFKINVAKLLYPEQDVSMVYHIRHIIADVVGSAMDRVLIEVRENGIVAPTYPTNRRLLSTPTIQSVVYVWVYAGSGGTGPLDGWPGTQDVAAKYVTPWKPAIVTRLTELLGFVSLDDAAQVDLLISRKPFRPQLHEYSVALAVDFDVVRTTDVAADVAAMTLAIKTSLSSTMTVPEADIRILSVKDFPTSSKPRFSVEVRMPTIAKMEAGAKDVSSQSAAIATQITTHIRANYNTMTVAKVDVRGDKVNTIVNSQMRTTESSNIGLIVGIVVGAVALVIAIAIFMMRHHKNIEPVESSVEVDNAPTSAERMYNNGRAREQVYVCPQTMTGTHPFQQYHPMYHNK